MSNTLAVAAVTATLRHLLEDALAGDEPGPVGSATVTTLRPEEIARAGNPADLKAINIFLYQVTPNHAWNLTDLPTRNADGRLVRVPVAAIDLHYLISCHGADAALESQRLLARALLAFAVTPVLDGRVVTAAMARFHGDPDLGFLDDADLARQAELVKLAPTVLSLEEMSRLWGVLGTPYLLSVTYSATVVLMQPRLTPRPVLPVRRPLIEAVPSQPIRLARVETEPAGVPVGAGSVLVLAGHYLLGGGTLGTYGVRIGPVGLVPRPGSTDDRLTVLLGPETPAGVHAVQVVGTAGAGTPRGERVTARSNAMPVVVRPAVTIQAVDAATVRLAVAPPLQPGQDGLVTLDGLDGDRKVLRFPVPPDPDPRAEVSLARPGIPAGRWRVQIRVDGVDSLPVATGDTFLGPELVLP